MEPSKLYSLFLVAAIVVWGGAAWWLDNRKLFRILYANWKARRTAPEFVIDDCVAGLCLDCLAVKNFSDYESAICGVCDACGGEICPCTHCQETIHDLFDGVRDKDVLGINTDIKMWNPKTGIN